MNTSKNRWLGTVAGIFVATAVMPAAHADTFNLTITQGNCAGVAANCNAGAATFSTAVTSAATYSGAVNFNLQNIPGNTAGTLAIDTIGNFFATGPGTYTPTYNAGFSNSSTMSRGPTDGSAPFTNPATEIVFADQTAIGPSSISITHDDGIALFLGKTAGAMTTLLSGPSDGVPQSVGPPFTTVITAAILAADGGFLTLEYVAANGLPEVLQMTVTPVPLPATAWLFGAGLGGLALLTRRRRKSGVGLAA